MSTATPGADASGQGAIQIKFTTRSGTERYAGSFFETWRHPVLYANSFFNKVNKLPVNQIILNDYGGNVGGPIALPGIGGRSNAFFFTNYDELRQASELTRRRMLLTPAARTGLFSYTSGGVVRTTNLLELAAANATGGQHRSDDRPTAERVRGGHHHDGIDRAPMPTTTRTRTPGAVRTNCCGGIGRAA